MKSQTFGFILLTDCTFFDNEKWTTEYLTFSLTSGIHFSRWPSEKRVRNKLLLFQQKKNSMTSSSTL